ncbi:VC0807 family protein [Kitasatospora sp. HPMI-4]|uniref:VC0807 family protein n=1 Tax=Kitasatospora sp. HPMI-4 TaxID=3448443 RepID=UPI003F1C55C6
MAVISGSVLEHPTKAVAATAEQGSAAVEQGGATAEQGSAASALRPLLIDIALPLLAYYTAHSVCHLSMVASLTVSSIVPAVRAVLQLVRERSLNAFAALMLVVNVVGIGLSAVTGDARLMIAKDGATSSVIGLAVLVSAFFGQPLMTAGMRPFVVKGAPAMAAAWDRLMSGTAASVGASVAFRRCELGFSLVWGTALVAECVAKVIGAYTLPVATMAWLGTVFLVVAIVLGTMAGNVFAGRMRELVAAEAQHTLAPLA